jgi:SWI/SNF-related matrix-associated actin-dependent regulator 1 of chromatin subfamily A
MAEMSALAMDLFASLDLRTAQPSDNLSDMSRATDGEVDVELAEPYKLHSFQRAGVAYALKARRCILGPEMGLGKTPISQAAVEAAGAFPVIVICPAVMRLVWVDEVAKFFPHRTTTVVLGTKREAIPPADFIITGYSTLKDRLVDLLNVGASALIVDESQNIKNKGSAKKPVQQTAACLELAKAIPPKGMVLLLTGTPVTNRPIELVPQLEALGRLADFGGFMTFAKRYTGAYRKTIRIAGGYKSVWDFSGSTNAKELHEKLRMKCYYRVTKKEVLPELPPVQHSLRRLACDPGAMKEYREAEAAIIRYVGDRAAKLAEEMGEDPKSAAVEARIRAESAEHLVRIGELWRLAVEAKFDSATEWLDDFLASTDEKIIVFAQSRSVVDRLAKRYNAPRVWGGQADTERMASVKKFQSDPATRIIVCSIHAAGVGLTLTAATNVVFMEFDWTPAAIDQAIARAYGRMSDLHGVTSYYLTAAECMIEQDTIDLLDAKRMVVSAVTDGRDVDGNDGILGDLIVRMMSRAA